MSICFTCGNNLTQITREVNNIYGRSSHQKFFEYKNETEKKALAVYIKEKELPICCSSVVTTFISNKYLHHVPY